MQAPVFAQTDQQNSIGLSHQECQDRIGNEMQKVHESINKTKAISLALSSIEFQSKANGYRHMFTGIFTNMTWSESVCGDVKLKDVLVEFSLLNKTGGLVRYLDVGEDPALTKVTLVEFVNAPEIDNSHPAKPALQSPLMQFKSGFSAENVKCRDGLQLVIKASDGSPACVKPESVAKLVAWGWAKSQENSGILVTLSEGQREGPLLVQKIFSDSIEGLNFREYPIATNVGSPITLHVGDSASNGCTVELTLVKISGNTATFLKKENQNRPCPICLSENTVIDTPQGNFNVKELTTGMQVWTLDNLGHKQAGTILKIGKTLVLPTHKMVHLLLDDGRELFASAGHPTADGRLLGDLKEGDMLDNSKIKTSELVAYDENYTYDILPSGPTGFYWANGILLESTIK